jgi:hypothetical protein
MSGIEARGARDVESPILQLVSLVRLCHAQGFFEHRYLCWRETPFFTDRERAALAWTEAITLIASTHAPDEVYEEVRQRFTEEELVNLTLALVAINGWNRLCIAFRVVPGSYQPAAAQGVATGKSR